MNRDTALEVLKAAQEGEPVSRQRITAALVATGDRETPVPRGPANGIRTLEDLRIRCVVDAETGCWLYPTSISDDGLPRVAIPPGVEGVTTAKWITTTARKAGWLLAGNRINKGQRMYPECTERTCCNPGHTKCSTQQAMAKNWVRRGHLAVITSRQNTEVQQASLEQVSEVQRLTKERLTDREVAVLVGLHPQTVAKIRKGTHVRLRAMPAMSVFNMATA